MRNLQDPSKFKDVLTTIKRIDLVAKMLRSDHGSKNHLKSPYDEDHLSASKVMPAANADRDHTSATSDLISTYPLHCSPIIAAISATTAPLHPERGINDDRSLESEDGVSIPLSTACPVFYQAQGASPYFYQAQGESPYFYPSSYNPMYFQEPPPMFNPKPT